MEKILRKWHHEIQFGDGNFRLTGLCERYMGRGEETIFTSSPIDFDEENMIVTTKSGSRYKLVDCEGDIEQQKQYIREDIERGYYA